MSDVAVVAVAFAVMVVVVTVCATARPSAGHALTAALHALAAVCTALWPWSRRP